MPTARAEVERQGEGPGAYLRPDGLRLAEGCLRGAGPREPGPLADPPARETLLQELAALNRAHGFVLP